MRNLHTPRITTESCFGKLSMVVELENITFPPHSKKQASNEPTSFNV